VFSLSNLPIGQSRTLLYIYGGVHLLALYSIYLASLPAFHQYLSYAFLLISLLYMFCNRADLGGCGSIEAVSWDADQGRLQLRQKGGVKLEVCRVKRRAVMPFMVCLLCEVEERFFPIAVVIFRDACPPQDFRRLRVLALHGALDADDS